MANECSSSRLRSVRSTVSPRSRPSTPRRMPRIRLTWPEALAVSTTPARLLLMTAVGPPDWPTMRLLNWRGWADRTWFRVALAVMAIYLDHAATTPLDPDVLAAMQPFFTNVYGNPSSAHEIGQGARMALDQARENVAGLIGASPNEIIFTGGGTESNNAALRGLIQ